MDGSPSVFDFEENLTLSRSRHRDVSDFDNIEVALRLGQSGGSVSTAARRRATGDSLGCAPGSGRLSSRQEWSF